MEVVDDQEAALVEVSPERRPLRCRSDTSNPAPTGIQAILMKCGRDDLIPRVVEIAEEKNDIASRLRQKLTPAEVPAGDRRVLKQLRNCGLLLAIGTTRRNGLETLNRVQLTSYFDAIVTGNEAAEKIQIWSLALR